MSKEMIEEMARDMDELLINRTEDPSKHHLNMAAYLCGKGWHRQSRDMVPKEEADKWYHEYHVIKDALKTEKMYHRETEKLADKYFVECKHLQEMLEAAMSGQETLQKYFMCKVTSDGIRLKYNEETGEWDKYEPYMTIECPEEKDYAFIETAIAKQVLKKPLKESLADYNCPTCGAHINFDGLNGNIEHAPKYCSECGQRLDWRKDNEHKPD